MGNHYISFRCRLVKNQQILIDTFLCKSFREFFLTINNSIYRDSNTHVSIYISYNDLDIYVGKMSLGMLLKTYYAKELEYIRNGIYPPNTKDNIDIVNSFMDIIKAVK